MIPQCPQRPLDRNQAPTEKIQDTLALECLPDGRNLDSRWDVEAGFKVVE